MRERALRIRVFAALALATGLPVARAAQEAAGAPAPESAPPGPIVYEGKVGAVYAPAGRVRLQVSRVRFPGVPDLTLADPKPALLLMGANGQQIGGIHVQDLKPGQGLSVSVTYAVDDPNAAGRPTSVRRIGVTQPPSDIPPAPANGSPKPADAWPSIVFPVLGRVSWSDTFGAPRDGGSRRPQGQDLMAPKMRPVLAAFDGEVWVSKSPGSNSVGLSGHDGWSATYLHLKNDHPGTDDGQGSADYAIAPGLSNGDWVAAGQMLGWVGDSGNAENTAPHLHFELHNSSGAINAAQTLRHARRLPAPLLPRVLPDARPGRGEVRLDGFIRVVDPGRRALQLDLRSVTDSRGRTRVVTFPERRWVRASTSVSPALLGEEGIPVEISALAAGMAVTAIGASSGAGTVSARLLRVDIQSFRADPPLAQAIMDYAVQLAGPADANAPASANQPGR
ncbi:MAG TPA: M23 family metallopeptidase [Armatimonadota bacterium]|jgi:murein DD-endopeptidase MepM/ murein hydrolase activator NlpD